MAGVALIPQCWKHFQFLKSQREIKAVGIIINVISAHLDSFDLNKRIAKSFGFIYCLFKKFSADPLAVIILLHTHDCQFHSMPSGFFQIKKADRRISIIGAKERSALAVRYVFLRSFRNTKPLWECFKYNSCDMCFRCIAINSLYNHIKLHITNTKSIAIRMCSTIW